MQLRAAKAKRKYCVNKIQNVNSPVCKYVGSVQHSITMFYHFFLIYFIEVQYSSNSIHYHKRAKHSIYHLTHRHGVYFLWFWNPVFIIRLSLLQFNRICFFFFSISLFLCFKEVPFYFHKQEEYNFFFFVFFCVNVCRMMNAIFKCHLEV